VVAVREGSNLTVSFEVKNTGPREGDEVVQLTPGDLVVASPLMKRTAGFERVHLKPGETKTVSFVCTPMILPVDRNMHFVVEPGKFRVMIGSGSEDIGDG